jgi:hypothetical protein
MFNEGQYALPLDSDLPSAYRVRAVLACASAAVDAQDCEELLRMLGLWEWVCSEEGRAVLQHSQSGGIVSEARLRSVPADVTELAQHYQRALEEVFVLRRALAFEAAQLENHLTATSLRPARVRQEMQRQVRRMTWAVQGGATAAYDTVTPQQLRDAMHEAAMPATLTREQWENPLSLNDGPSKEAWAVNR